MNRLALAITFLGGSPLAAQQDSLNLEYLKGYLRDGVAVVAAPARWDSSDWLRAGGLGGATVAAYTVDHAVQVRVQRQRGSTADDVADFAEPFGNGKFLLPGFVLAYGAGELAHSPGLRRIGLYGAESFILSGLIVNAIKLSTGRHRPYTGSTHEAWDGPSWSASADRTSFPSGHAASAFSVATVVGQEYADVRWAPSLAYGLAALTAASRVYGNKHWLSDVVLGSALGYFTARAVWARHPAEGRRLTLVPLPVRSGGGLALSRPF